MAEFKHLKTAVINESIFIMELGDQILEMPAATRCGVSSSPDTVRVITRGENQKFLPVRYKSLFTKSRIRDILRDLGGGTVLKCVMEQQGTKIWTGFDWLMIGPSFGFL